MALLSSSSGCNWIGLGSTRICFNEHGNLCSSPGIVSITAFIPQKVDHKNKKVPRSRDSVVPLAQLNYRAENLLSAVTLPRTY